MEILEKLALNYDTKKNGFIRPLNGLIETWLNARYTYCFSNEALKSNKKARSYAELGIKTLNQTLYDNINGGWFEDDSNKLRKNAYSHAFVLLASVFAVRANIKDSLLTFERITAVINSYFWDQHSNSCYESFASDWSQLEPYRGANSNMHMTEAFLATYFLTKDPIWLDRALAIAKRITDAAETYDYRVPEHFDTNWLVQKTYNEKKPNDAFRPYGVIPGHGFEWARLCLHLFHATANQQIWLEQASINLYQRAKKDSFQENGFHYTTDLTGKPVVSLRMHWVVCEAISAAATLGQHFSQKDLTADLSNFWDVANKYFVKQDFWLHELDQNNEPSFEIWKDNPDVYHAYNAIELTKNPSSLFLF